MNNYSTSQKEFLNKLSELMEANLENESFGVTELAREMGMSRSNLHRKLNSVLNKSISQYIREFRLEKAKELLKETSFTVSEITYKVGFGSTSYFIKCFRENFGYTPGESENHTETDESSGNHKKENKTVKLNRRNIVVWSLVFIVLASVFYMVIWPKIKSSPQKEKTIAIMHFEDLSPSAEKSYIINGLREDILDNLFSVRDIEVIPEVMMDQYKNSGLSTLEIAKKTNANYILTAKGETNNEQTTVWFELLETKSGKQLWRENKNLSLGNYFDLRKEVAYVVVNELKANLSVGEREKLEKIPTENLIANDLYLKGQENLQMMHFNPQWSTGETNYIKKAKYYYEQAIKEDSTFSEAYAALSHIYHGFLAHTSNPDLAYQYLDSGYIMANKALKFDPENTFALLKIESYYEAIGDTEKRDKALNKYLEASNLTKDDYEYHRVYFWLYVHMDDYYNCVRSFFKYRELLPSNQLITAVLYRFLTHALSDAGFPKLAKKYALQILNQTKDSATYFEVLIDIEQNSGNRKAALDNSLSLKRISSGNNWHYFTSMFFLIENRKYQEAYNVMKEYSEKIQESGDTILPFNFFGFILLKNGLKKEAEYHFDRHRQRLEKQIKYNFLDAQMYYSHFNLACNFAALNNKKKALEYLVQIKNRKTMPRWLLHELKELPLLDNIRNEPEFQEVLTDAEAKYEKEHQRVGELLRKYGEIE